MSGTRNIPEEEWRHLVLAVADAREWAQQGRVALGYVVRMRGTIHAEQALLDAEPWARNLLTRWRAMIEDYCQRYDDTGEE